MQNIFNLLGFDKYYKLNSKMCARVHVRLFVCARMCVYVCVCYHFVEQKTIYNILFNPFLLFFSSWKILFWGRTMTAFWNKCQWIPFDRETSQPFYPLTSLSIQRRGNPLFSIHTDSGPDSPIQTYLNCIYLWSKGSYKW